MAEEPALPVTVILAGMPRQWAELITGLAMMAGREGSGTYPTHCEHDTMTVCADPKAFTDAELDRLDALGFFVPGRRDDDDQPVGREHWEDYFTSYRFGSA
jgi:hypothetical protein